MNITRVICRDCSWDYECGSRAVSLRAGEVHGTGFAETLGHVTKEVPPIHDGRHPDHWKCAPCRIVRSRRNVIMTRALHHPEGLTPYEFTKGMTRDDSLQFWNDAKALGLIGVGKNQGGTRMFALSSYKAPRGRR